MTEPRIPGHTCPLIDKIQAAIDRAFRIADDADSEDAQELRAFLKDIRYELLGESDKLEAIRDANLALRNAVEYWQAEAEKLADPA